MWGVVASILGASVALAVAHTAYETFAHGSSKQEPDPQKTGLFPKSGEGDHHQQRNPSSTGSVASKSRNLVNAAKRAAK